MLLYTLTQSLANFLPDFLIKQRRTDVDNLETLKQLVNIKSISLEDNSEIINYLITKFQPYSKEILKISTPNSNSTNLLIGINTEIKNTKAIILSGHIDTVVANEQEYKTNPYFATILDNKMFGLGVIDMKCYFASIIDNLDKISKLNKPFIIAISGDEETNLNGIKEITKTLKQRNITPLVSIIGEPTSLNICTTSKGCFEYQIDINGKSCHSSNPKNGTNACYIMAKLISFIENINLKYPNTTLNVGISHGGKKANIVPDNASLVFDIRSNKQAYVDLIIQEIEQCFICLKNTYQNCEIILKQNLAIPMLEENENSPVNILLEKFNLKKDEFIGGCEAGYFQAIGGDAFIFGAGDLALAHKPIEYLNLKNYTIYNKIFIKMLNFLDKFYK